MRKNSPRKWLHACLDLLPVILIPVFMIYSHRHDVTENVQVNYKFQTNVVNDPSTDLINGNTYLFHIDLTYSPNNSQTLYLFNNLEDYVYFEVINFTGSLVPNISNGTNYVNTLSFKPYWNSTAMDVFTTTDVENDIVFQLLSSGTLNFDDRSGYIEFICTYQNYYSSSIFDDYVNVYELPSSLNVIDNVDTTNSNAMDSFMNNFNITINKYFNMGNVFNLNGVYQWFNTNIFNGNAPQVIYSVWNIALYELVMDLLFLLYGLFMWFIDIVQHLMDKPFKSIK